LSVYLDEKLHCDSTDSACRKRHASEFEAAVATGLPLKFVAWYVTAVPFAAGRLALAAAKADA